MSEQSDDRVVGIIQEREERPNSVVASEKLNTPDVIVMNLAAGPDNLIETPVAKAGTFTLQVLTTENEEHSSFVGIVMGVAGQEAFYAPFSADRADKFAETLKEAAASLREFEKKNVN